MVSSNNAINNTVGASISGVTNTFTVTNASNTASSAARETITVGGASAGDPTLNFNISGVTNFEMGIDNSDSDSYKIAIGTALGTSDCFVMDTSGRRTLPLQPCFQANGDTALNVTGNGTEYAIGSSSAMTEVFDVGGNFNPGNGAGTPATFTAPIDGKYFISCGVATENAGAGINQGYFRFIAGGNNYTVAEFNPTNVLNVGGGIRFSGAHIIEMDAMDAVTWVVNFAGGAKTVDMRTSHISGALFC